MSNKLARGIVWQILSSLLGLCLFGVGLYVIHRQLGRYNAGDILADLKTVAEPRLLLFLVIVILDYLIMAVFDQLGLQNIKRVLPFRRTLQIAFVGNMFGINANILAGSTVRYRLYSRWKITLNEVGQIVAFCYATFVLGFLAVAGGTFILNPFSLPTALQIPGASTRAIGIFFLLAVLIYLFLSLERVHELRARSWQIGIPMPDIAFLQVLAGIVEWLLSATALFVLMPGSTSITFLHFLGAFVVAHFLGQISQSPAGLGVFEASLLLLLPNDVSSSAAIASLLVYRVLYYFIPLLLATGLFGYLEFMRPNHHETAEANLL